MSSKVKDAPVVDDPPIDIEAIKRRRAPVMHDDDKARLCMMLSIETEEGEEPVFDRRLEAEYFVVQKAHHQTMPGPLPLKLLKKLIFDVTGVRVAIMGGGQQQMVPENEIGGGDRIVSRNN